MTQTPHELDCRNALSRAVRHEHSALLWPIKCPPISAYPELFPHAPLPFIEQDTQLVKTSGGYETYIEKYGNIPTRPNNWHDYYNALSWELFPEIKKSLHASQCDYPAKDSANNRSPEQNGATLFDENGIILLTETAWLEQALTNHDWDTLFIQQREELIKSSKILILGHALWEKSRAPYIGMTGKCLVQRINPGDLHHQCPYDLANQLIPKRLPLRSTDLFPLPLLGWPNICEANKAKSFYHNTQYFRKKSKY